VLLTPPFIPSVAERSRGNAHWTSTSLRYSQSERAIRLLDLESCVERSTEDLAILVPWDQFTPARLSEFPVFANPNLLWILRDVAAAFASSGALEERWREMHAWANARGQWGLGLMHAGPRLLDHLSALGLPPAVNLFEFHPFLVDEEVREATRRSGAQAWGLSPFLFYSEPDERLRACTSRLEDLAAQSGVTARELELSWMRSWEMTPVLGFASPVEPSSGALDASRLEVLRSCVRHWDEPACLAARYALPQEDSVRTVPLRSAPDGTLRDLYPHKGKSELDSFQRARRIWHLGFNPLATVRFRAAPPVLDENASRVLAELNANGFAFSNVKEMALEPLFEKLKHEVQELPRATTVVKNTFEHLHESRHGQDLGQESKLRAVADHYFGLSTLPFEAKLWAIPPHLPKEPRGAQRWHLDYEDLYVLKVFVLLSEVTELDGPTEVMRGTHPKGPHAPALAGLLRALPEGDFGYSDDDIFSHVDPRLRTRLVGVPGTVVFLDTRSLHRGGLSFWRERKSFTVTFTSPNRPFQGVPQARRWNALWKPFRWPYGRSGKGNESTQAMETTYESSG
jgi:hypothetical protein